MATLTWSMTTCLDELTRVMRSSRATRSIRACLLATRDRDQALALLKQAAEAASWPLYHFTAAERRRFTPSTCRWETVGTGSDEAADLLRHAQELRAGGLVAVEETLATLRDSRSGRRARMQLAQMLSGETDSDGLVVVFVAPPEAEEDLPAMLADQVVRLAVPYPRAKELEAIAREELASLACRNGTPLPVEANRRQARLLAPGVVGLTRSAARDALRDAVSANPRDVQAAVARLERCKAVHLGRELAMNVLDTADVEEPVGLEYLLEYLTTAAPTMRVTGPGRAKGLLLIGPPGTGKTMLARAIGKVTRLPVVEFRISALMNSLLGETERRFAQAFATLEAMAPNVVFIDEIEKTFGDSSERDGGTMMRCTGALLSWLSDNPHPNFVVATSNSLKRMGDIGLTMTRSERFDSAFFVDVPRREARRLMLAQWLDGAIDDPGAVADVLADLTDKFSGADLRSVVKHALAVAKHSGQPLSLDLLKLQVERKRLRAIALYDEFEDLRRWGRLYCEPAGPSEDETAGGSHE